MSTSARTQSPSDVSAGTPIQITGSCCAPVSSRSATSPGSSPFAATLDRTSAQLKTLTVVPAMIASTVASAPGASYRSASNAEASSTDVGRTSAIWLAAEGRLFSVLGSRLGPPFRDQLIGHRSARVAAEHPPQGLGRRLTAPLNFSELCSGSHNPHRSAGRLAAGNGLSICINAPLRMVFRSISL